MNELIDALLCMFGWHDPEFDDTTVEKTYLATCSRCHAVYRLKQPE